MDMYAEYIILGAGPAGLQLAYLFANAKMDYLVLEQADKPGAFFQQFPRHRTLISINKRYTGSDNAELNLRMDWNSLLSHDKDFLFTQYSDEYFPHANDFLGYLRDYAKRYQLNICFNTQIVNIDREQLFVLTDKENNCYRCRYLIMATGVSQPNLPSFPGHELIENYNTVSVDADEFINQRVLIIGKGNSAFETADNLVARAAVIHVAGERAIKLAWQTHYVGHLRAVNNNLLDTYQLKSQNAILDGRIVEIKKINEQYHVRFSFSRADEVEKELIYDRVIACTGFRFDDSIFAEACRPQMVINQRYPAQTSSWESTNIPGLYFAGVLMQVRDYKKSTSGFVHGFRYTVRALFHMLQQQYQGQIWPSQALNGQAVALTKAIIDRVNCSSALWQQFEVMGDVITVGEKDCAYYQELPLDYVHENNFAKQQHYITISLEYGPDHAKVDPFDIEVKRVAQDDARQAFDAQYLHPVIRHYQRGKLLSTHHIAENLENDWTDPHAHQQPLQQFLQQVLSLTRQQDVA